MQRVVVYVNGGVAQVVTCPDGIDVEIVDFDDIEAEHDLLRHQVWELMQRLRDGYDPDVVQEVVERGSDG